eukprot:13650393-Alexandrium_andersonii.AAC.1
MATLILRTSSGAHSGSKLRHRMGVQKPNRRSRGTGTALPNTRACSGCNVWRAKAMAFLLKALSSMPTCLSGS